MTAASFAYAVWRTAVDPVAAYFSTPARAWEFGVGALLALAGARATHGSVPLRIGVAWIGLAAIVFSAFTYSNETPFPGFAAAVPVLERAIEEEGALAMEESGMLLTGMVAARTPVVTAASNNRVSRMIFRMLFSFGQPALEKDDESWQTDDGGHGA